MEDAWAIARFTAFAELGAPDVSHLQGLTGAVRRLARGETLRREGDTPPTMYLLHSGWTASSITVSDGARQILKVHMPGDLLGLPSLALTRAYDTIQALSPALVSVVDSSDIGRIFENNPRLAALLFLISQEERVRLMDRLASLGRTDAIGRIAQLILQLHTRVLCNDSGAGDSFHIPLTQGDLADLTGLSKVHVNRTIQQLRQDNIVHWRGRTMTIVDPARLRTLTELTPREIARDLSWLPKQRHPPAQPS